MNWCQFNDPVSYLCIVGVESRFEPFAVMTNIFVTEFSKFRKTFREDSNVFNDFETK